MYLLRGSLSWQGLQAKNKEERYKKIIQKKQKLRLMIYAMVSLLNSKDMLNIVKI